MAINDEEYVKTLEKYFKTEGIKTRYFRKTGIKANHPYAICRSTSQCKKCIIGKENAKHKNFRCYAFPNNKIKVLKRKIEKLYEEIDDTYEIIRGIQLQLDVMEEWSKEHDK